MARKDFRVVIVGGSITALTLANILERLGIDFIVLEAYREIAPQVGASIGLWPNGLRILDQIGCYEPFAKDVDFLNEMTLRVQGKTVGAFSGIASQMRKRHGYEVVFHDRQRLLQVLYDNLKRKDRILLSTRAVNVVMTKLGIRVDTIDKGSFEGHIVVGADGIHSTVRQEMWRIGRDIAPMDFPADELKRVPISYRALFGISKPMKSLPSTLINTVWNKGWSNLILGGPSGRVYWFLFERLQQTAYGDNFPRYTKQDEMDLVEKHRNDVITEEVTLGDLYDSSLSSGMTALHDWTFKRWYLQRIITLGDAAHKMNPITGQGGNTSIEDAAALVNNLVRRLDVVGGPLSDVEIDGIFGETQAVHQVRARLAVDFAYQVQKVEAMENPMADILVRLMLPLLSRDMRLERHSGVIVEGIKVEKLPLPKRAHFVPYVDELPTKPIVKTRLPKLATVMCLLMLFSMAMDAQRFRNLQTTFLAMPTTRAHTRNWVLQNLLLALTRIFSSLVASEDMSRQMQTVKCMAMLIPAILIWTIEGHRRGNKQTILGRLLTWPSFLAAACQQYGIARIGPLYYLLSIFASSNPIYQRTTGRIVDPSIAQALLPVMCLNLVIPCILISLQSGNNTLQQNMVTLVQVMPIITGLLTSLIASTLRRIKGRKDHDPHELAELSNEDLPYLLQAYSLVFFATATIHVYATAFMASSPTLSLANIYSNLSNPSKAWRSSGANGEAFDIFKYEMTIYIACVTLWCLYSVFEMRRLGYVRTCQAWVAGLGVLASMFVLGPGAMYVGTWYWREKVVARLSR